MEDPVHQGFLEKQVLVVKAINDRSDSVRISQDPASRTPPNTYNGVLIGAEHFEREDGAIRVVKRPIPFQIQMQSDYCRSMDSKLQFRVVQTTPSLFHPNIRGGMVCLGPRFRPATSLRAVTEQFYRIATGRVCAMNDPFDPEAADFYLDHIEQVRAFESQPLWRQPIAGRIRVEETKGSAPASAPTADSGSSGGAS